MLTSVYERANTESTIIDIGRSSDGTGRRVGCEGMILNNTYYEYELANILAQQLDFPQSETTYKLDRLPKGYTGCTRRISTTGDFDTFVFGHPNGGVFESAEQFFTHFMHLQGYSRGQDCHCVRCTGPLVVDQGRPHPRTGGIILYRSSNKNRDSISIPPPPPFMPATSAGSSRPKELPLEDLDQGRHSPPVPTRSNQHSQHIPTTSTKGPRQAKGKIALASPLQGLARVFSTAGQGMSPPTLRGPASFWLDDLLKRRSTVPRWTSRGVGHAPVWYGGQSQKQSNEKCVLGQCSMPGGEHAVECEGLDQLRTPQFPDGDMIPNNLRPETPSVPPKLQRPRASASPDSHTQASMAPGRRSTVENDDDDDDNIIVRIPERVPKSDKGRPFHKKRKH